MPSRRRKLTTFDEVVEELGGINVVVDLTKQKNSAAIYNWRRRRSRFPTKYYKKMIRRLNARGATAPDHLWGFAE
jgi:hypothetical protein